MPPRTYGTAALKGGYWHVQAEPHVAMRLKRLFKKAGRQHGTVKLAATDEVSRDLLWFTERYPLELSDLARESLEERAASFDARIERFDALLAGRADPRAFELAIPARTYQRVAADLALQSGGLLVADDVGLGKTCSAIAMLTDPDTRPALIVTLTHLPRQWAREIQRFAPGLRTHVIKKGTPYEFAVVRRRKRRSDDQLGLLAPEDEAPRQPDVIIINYHKLNGWADALAGKVRTVVFDEVQELRRSESNKYSAAKHVADAAHYRVGLSVSGDSIVELRGGAFGQGWVGPIEDAAEMLGATPGTGNVAVWPEVWARGWTGSGFGWKRVRKFIAHACDRASRGVFVAGDWLTMTDDHSAFRGLDGGAVEEVRTETIVVGDVLPVDDGRGWESDSAEEPVDVAALLAGHPKAQVAVSLDGLTREDLGIERAWEWANYNRPGPFGSRLPVDTFLRCRDVLPHPTAVYFGRCKKSYRCAPLVRLSDWAYILGFFLGDGWVSGSRVAFAVENRLAEQIHSRLQDLRGIELDPRTRSMPGQSVEVRCNNAIFARVLESVFGEGIRCNEKFIPGEWIVSWPRAARLALLRGMIDSDGHLSAKSNRVYYSTTSQRLARGLLSLLRSVGVVGGIHERSPSAGGEIDGRKIVGRRTAYIVNWSWFAMQGDNAGHRGTRRRLRDSEGHFREGIVRKIDTDRTATSVVYDLEMDGHPSFVANGVLVHNSATPIYNFGIEFFNVMAALRPGSLGTRGEFIEEWCKGGGGDPNKIPIADPKAFGTYAREAGLMIRRTRADVGRELPHLTKSVVHVDADEKALDRVTGNVAELARTILAHGGDWHTKGQAARDFDMKMRQATGIAKAPYVAEFVKLLVESGEKVVLYGWHREVYSIWQDRLRDCRPVLYTGSESSGRKEENARAFIEGDAKVLVMSLRSGAGLDGLQGHCRNVVFGELDWSPGVHEQAVGRVHRDGQGDPVMAYFLVTDSGADPTMIDVLGLKRAQVDGLRDPDGAIVESIATDAVKQLAASYLRQRGLSVPGEAA